MKLPDTSALYADVGGKLAGKVLACAKCRKSLPPLTEQQAAGHLRTGWPLCCGETMLLSGPIENPQTE